jgi:hypothetical protein
LDRKERAFKEQVNGTGTFVRLEKGQSIEPRIVSPNITDLENVEMIRIEELC